MTRAKIIVHEGQILLDDPDALAVAKAVGKYNCRITVNVHIDRVRYFVERMSQKGLTYKEAGIVLINVDSLYGDKLAAMLMPNEDWQPYRDRGEIPYARGIVMRDGLTEDISMVDVEAGKKLREMDDIPIIVFDHDVVEVVSLEEAREIALEKFVRNVLS